MKTYRIFAIIMLLAGGYIFACLITLIQAPIAPSRFFWAFEGVFFEIGWYMDTGKRSDTLSYVDIYILRTLLEIYVCLNIITLLHIFSPTKHSQ